MLKRDVDPRELVRSTAAPWLDDAPDCALSYLILAGLRADDVGGAGIDEAWDAAGDELGSKRSK